MAIYHQAESTGTLDDDITLVTGAYNGAVKTAGSETGLMFNFAASALAADIAFGQSAEGAAAFVGIALGGQLSQGYMWGGGLKNNSSFLFQNYIYI